MGTTPTVGRSIERLATQRVLDHIHAEKKRGRSIYTLTEIAEATGLDPTTAVQVMGQLEDGGPYTVEAADTAYAERQWHVRGSAYDLDGWDCDAWNVRE